MGFFVIGGTGAVTFGVGRGTTWDNCKKATTTFDFKLQFTTGSHTTKLHAIVDSHIQALSKAS